MNLERVKVGIVGCGSISSAYLGGCRHFDILDVVACADLDVDRAKARAAEFDVPKAYDVDSLLADSGIDVVLNLTTPQAHAGVALAALEAGKHVYGEKPLAVTREDGKAILQTARERGLLVGSAPDTFMGGPIHTGCQLIQDGWIGEPVGAFGAMMSRGPESWHPNPEFVYSAGAGPLFDMGPYYLTALVSILGPVSRVTGSARISFPERTITAQARFGEKIKVHVPTHVVGVLDFASGAVGTLLTSFDVLAAGLPHLEIYGSEGSLSLPDPNGFKGPVRFRSASDDAWRELPLIHSYEKPGRGIGLADMAIAIRTGRQPRASGALAYHVLDLMHAFYDASLDSRHVQVESSCTRPELLPRDLAPVFGP